MKSPGRVEQQPGEHDPGVAALVAWTTTADDWSYDVAPPDDATPEALEAAAATAEQCADLRDADLRRANVYGAKGFRARSLRATLAGWRRALVPHPRKPPP